MIYKALTFIGILLGLLFAIVVNAHGQTLPNAVPMPSAVVQFVDANGVPVAGGKLYTCVAGSSCPGNPQATYTDSTAGVQNANPVILDSAGRAQVWIGASAYKLVLQDANSVQQWTQDNVSDTTLFFVNYVKTAGTATLISYDPPNGQTQTTVAAELTALTSSPYINLKLNCGAKGDGVTNDSTAIAACLANNAIVFAPTGTYCLGSPLIIPNKTELLGAGRGDTSPAFNTVFKACAGFPTSNPVISLCSVPGPCSGVKVENLTIDCAGISGCIGGENEASQEQSWFRKVMVLNAPGDGFLVGYAAQNSGPYADLEVEPNAFGVAGTTCFHITVISGIGVSAWRGLNGITCNGNGYLGTRPLNAIFLEGTAPGSVTNLHVEHWTTGIQIGSMGFGASDLSITNISTGPNNPTSINLYSSGVQNVTIFGAQNSTAAGNVLVDTCNSVTLAATTAGLGLYATGYGGCGQQTVITTRQDAAVTLQTSLKILKNLSIPGTVTLADDGRVCFGPASAYCLFAHESVVSGVPGPVIQTHNEGLLIQNSQVPPGATGGGLALNGNCYTADGAFSQIGTGMTSDCGTFTARATSAAILQLIDGGIKFYSDTGLTIGNTYTPTLRFQWFTSGHFQVQSGGTYSYNGNDGFTGTKTAGTCSLTIQAGIITNVTGC